jgi:hypothetical protein
MSAKHDRVAEVNALIKTISDYVRTGEQLGIGWIWPQRFNDSNIWGYAEDEMSKCRAEAVKSPVIRVNSGATGKTEREGS